VRVVEEESPGRRREDAEAAGKPSPPRFVFGVDLDGVCADFYGALRPIAAEWLGVSVEALTQEVTYGLPEWNLGPMGGYTALHRFAVMQRKLFAEALPITGAGPALRRLSAKGIRIRIITNRLFIKHFHQEAVAQTIEWLDHHGVPYWDLCLMPDKAAVGADLYIDDTPDNIAALRANGLPTIVFTNSTNRNLDPPRADNWEDVEELVSREFMAWQTRPDAKTPPAGH
jgi:phosphoglycolate phosphatase-like HAD superfamily hydrolase